MKRLILLTSLTLALTLTAAYAQPEDREEHKPALDPAVVLKTAKKTGGSSCATATTPPLSAEVKLTVDCPTSRCQLDRMYEFYSKSFKPKISEKSIWLYDYGDKRLKGKVTIRKRIEKGVTSLTVKLKDLKPADVAIAMSQYLPASGKGSKCEQDWNATDGDASPVSCSLTVTLDSATTSAESNPANAKNLLSEAQRNFIRELKGIDLTENTEPFAEPSTFESGERKLLSDSDIASEIWWKTDPATGAKSCYAFELSKKVTQASANDAFKKLKEAIAPYTEGGPCNLTISADQKKTKSM